MEFSHGIFIDIPSKLHDCGTRYALTCRESLERECAARGVFTLSHRFFLRLADVRRSQLKF